MEYKSRFPKSKIVAVPEVGHLVMFRYEAKTAEKLRFYDKNPLVLVVLNENEMFYGTNLHYYNPKSRLGIIQMIQEMQESGNQTWEKFLFGSTGFHKYLKSEVRSLFLDVAQEEWEAASLLPAEEFVRNLGGAEVPVSNRSVY